MRHFLFFFCLVLLFCPQVPQTCVLGHISQKISVLGFWDCCWPNVMSSCLTPMSVHHHRHPFNHSPGMKHVRAHKTKDKADKAGSSEQLICVECGTEEHLPKCELPSVCLSHLEGNNAQVYKIQITEHSHSYSKMCQLIPITLKEKDEFFSIRHNSYTIFKYISLCAF